jgi:predicted dehydrogenase
MYGLAPWYIDLLNNFLEGSPERLDVFGSFPRSTSRMEMGTATLQYPGGAVGEWAFSLYTANEMELRLKIVGTDGEAEVNLMSGAYRRRSRDGEWQSAVADCSRPVYGFVGMRESVAAFLSAIEAGGGTRSGPATYRRLQPVLSSLGRSERERWSVRPATR